MILSAADLAARINSPRNSLRGKTPAGSRSSQRTSKDLDRNDIPAGPDLYIRNSTPGSRPGDKKISDEVKVPAAILANLGVSNNDIAETFGISPTSVSNIRNGQVSEEAKEKIDASLDRIQEVVASKLEATLSYLTEDKMHKADGPQAVSMARGLASIIKDIRPEKKSGDDNRVQVVINSVNQKDVNHYDVIEVTT